jgi:hypothetical protein
MSFFPRSAAVWLSLAALAFAVPAGAGLGVGPSSPIDPVRFPAVRNQDQVAAADNGTITLFAWRDARHGDGDLFGARVRHDGTVLDPNGIELAAGAGEQGEPAVSWDGVQWLVAWTDAGAVKVQRVSTAGALLDAIPTTLSNASVVASHPSLAWNGALHIAVWSESAAGQQKVLSATLDNNGTVKASAAALTLGVTDDQPSIAHLGVNALVVFRTRRAGNDDIDGVRVTAALPSGTVTRLDATDFALVSQTDGQESPAVAASGTAWLAAWQDNRNHATSGTDIRGTRVTAAGVVQDANGIDIASPNGDDRAVALTHDGSKWLATWTGASGQELRDIANNGNPGGSPVSVSAQTPLTGDGAFGGAAANPIVAWSDPGADDSDLLGRRVGANLALDPAFTIATQTPNQTEPAHAFGSNHWMIAWVDDRFGADQRQIRFGMTDSARFEPPNPLTVAFAVPRVGLDQGHPALAFDGTNFNLFWEESRGGRRIVCGARFTAGGAPLDTFTVAGDAWNQYEPSAFAFSYGVVLVTWTDTRAGATERDVYAAQLLNGSISAGPAAMSNVAGVREEHAVCAPLQEFQALIAYETSAPGVNRGIEAVELFGGSMAFPYHTTIAKEPTRTFERPSIAENGEDAMIAYQEVVFSDGPSLHIPFGREYQGDADFPYFLPFPFGPGSYTPANPVVGSAGYDFVPLWSTRTTGDIDVVVTAVDPNAQILQPTPTPLTADPVIDTPGAATQGLGDRVGLSYMRSLSDTTWSGLQLYGGEAQDTLRGKIVINEFLAHPSSTQPEFYELFNVSGRSFLLNGWKLRVDDDTVTVTDCTFSDLKKHGRETNFGPADPSRIEGTPCSFLDDHDFFTDTTFFFTPKDPIEGHLPDRGAVLELTSPSGVVVDRVGYGYKGGAPVSGAIPTSIAPLAVAPGGEQAARAGGGSGASPGPVVAAVGDSTEISTARIPNGTDTQNNANDFNLTGTSTPNSVNVGTAAQLGTSIFVSRAYWNPSTGEPAVEFLNPSTSQTYDFTGWYLSNNVSTEKIGVDVNAFSNMKPLATRTLVRGLPGSFRFFMDELSVLYLMDENFTRFEQLGWSRPVPIAPDMCVTRFQGTGGTHDGYDWFTCGGQDNILTGELRYTTCSIQSPNIDVPPLGSALSFAGARPNPSHAGQSPVLVFSVPGGPGDAPVRARLALYDVAGRRVAVLADDTYPPGEQRVPLARMDQARRLLPAGTYYADLTIAGQRLRRTIVFLN